VRLQRPQFSAGDSRTVPPPANLNIPRRGRSGRGGGRCRGGGGNGNGARGAKEALIMCRSRKDSYSIVGSLRIFVQLLTLLAFVWWH